MSLIKAIHNIFKTYTMSIGEYEYNVYDIRNIIRINTNTYKSILVDFIHYCLKNKIHSSTITTSLIKFFLTNILKIDDQFITRDLLNKLKDDSIKYLKQFENTL